MEKEYVDTWTHTMNEKGNVEIRMLVGDREFFLEIEDRDVKSIHRWVELKPLLRKW